MAARKLQTEIDKTLKKVSEGVEQFEDQYKKIQQTANPAHKEKLEAELKTQIKKLQRLRDQIKTWLASNEIKDKKVLTDNRKLIETQMEKFKACEKEMKTKAFSKEGLSAASKLDPKEQLKIETGAWISTQVDELSRQIESTEAEVEQLQGGAKKSKKGGAADRVSELEAHNERRKWHVSRLELINRLMENGNLEPDRVSGLREDISYFVESNTEEDFEEDELIYDDLNLDEQEEAFGLAADDIQSSHDSMSIADTSDLPPPPTRTPVKASAPPKVSTASRETTVEADGERSPVATKTRASSSSVPQRKPTLDGTASRPPGLAASSSRTSSSAVPSASTTAPKDTAPTPSAPAARAVPAVLPPIRYSAAAASAVNPPTPSASSATTSSSQTAAQALGLAATASAPSGALAAVAGAAQASAAQVASPTSSTGPAAPVPASTRETPAQAVPSPQVSKASLPSAASSTAPPSEMSPSPAPSHASVVPNNLAGLTPPPASVPTDSSAILSPSQQAASLAPLQALEVGSQPQQQQPGNSQPAGPDASPNTQQRSIQQSLSLAGPTSPQAGSATSEPRLPSSLADLVTSFESAKQKSLRRDNDLSAIEDILEAGYANIPQPSDAEKPKYYIPRNPYPTPHYYPQQPSPHLANPSLFAKFDVDTLFYIFYYCQGSYMQYLAAQELKKQSWRFHKQYLTWFQRANEPQAITDEYEQGVYLYFDFEGSWAQRRKENFSFFYRHLEE